MRQVSDEKVNFFLFRNKSSLKLISLLHAVCKQKKFAFSDRDNYSAKKHLNDVANNQTEQKALVLILLQTFKANVT